MPPPSTTMNQKRMINTLVVIVKGTTKGLMGVIKDIQADNARVELATNNRTVSIPLAYLKRKEQVLVAHLRQVADGSVQGLE